MLLKDNRLRELDASLGELPRLDTVDLTDNTDLSYVPEKLRRLHDKHTLLHSKQRRRDLVKRAISVRTNVTKRVQDELMRERLKQMDARR